MVQYSNLRARVPHLYAMVQELRQALNAPDILEGRKLYDLLLSYGEDFMEQRMAEVADTLADNEEHHSTAVAALRAVLMSVREVTEHGVSPESDEWKQESLDFIKRRLDRFLATRPPPAVNGGRRRKTRRRKARRYSRRR